jgi:hypothetical protein
MRIKFYVAYNMSYGRLAVEFIAAYFNKVTEVRTGVVLELNYAQAMKTYTECFAMDTRRKRLVSLIPRPFALGTQR